MINLTQILVVHSQDMSLQGIQSKQRHFYVEKQTLVYKILKFIKYSNIKLNNF